MFNAHKDIKPLMAVDVEQFYILTETKDNQGAYNYLFSDTNTFLLSFVLILYTHSDISA